MTTGSGQRRAPASLGDLAREAAARGGQRPFVTFYDDASGERSELGHATADNWVSKTANLLAGELDLQPGARVTVSLGTHWTSLVVLLAAWRCGVVVQRDGDRTADAFVVAERDAGPFKGSGPTVLVGEGFGGRVAGDAGDAIDFGQGVLACEDDFDDPPVGRDTPALVEPAAGQAREQRTPLSHGALLDLAAAAADHLGLGAGQRLLLRLPLETTEGLVVAVAALLAGTSIVVVANASPGADRARVVAERCDLVIAADDSEAAAEVGIPVRRIIVERDAAGVFTGLRAAG